MKGITGLKEFAHGHRGVVSVGFIGRQKVAVKSKLPSSEAVGRVENEAAWLRRLNAKGIGPKLLKSGKGWFACEFVEGMLIEEFAAKASRKALLSVISAVFGQCFIMDSMGIDKEEMHHPYKHVIITKGGKPVMIDFERCHFTEGPKNVTQLCQLMISTRFGLILKGKGINAVSSRIIAAARRYKRDMGKENLKGILKEIM